MITYLTHDCVELPIKVLIRLEHVTLDFNIRVDTIVKYVIATTSQWYISLYSKWRSTFLLSRDLRFNSGVSIDTFHSYITNSDFKNIFSYKKNNFNLEGLFFQTDVWSFVLIIG